MEAFNNLNYRYPRQIAIPEIGKAGQQKLLEGSVFIIGCGALGSMVAMQLAGAGIGRIGLADYDNIEISNLQRQFFFKSDEAGVSKAITLSKRIMELNPTIYVETYTKIVTKTNISEFIADYDFIVDATDNPDSKQLIDKISKELRKPCCIGGVRDFSGQVITILPEDFRFNDIFGEAGESGFLPCSLGGVAGPAAALCASIQAGEVIKYIIGAGSLLSGRLFLFNMLNNQYSVFSL